MNDHRRKTNSKASRRRRPPRDSGDRRLHSRCGPVFGSLAAVLFLLPANRVGTSVSGSITAMASGEPGWYASFLNHVGNWFGAAGVQQTWLLAVISVGVGLGPLLFRRYEAFLAVGAILALLFWLTAQGLGGILTGSGTDPNTGPLVIVLAFAMVPTVVADRSSWLSPLERCGAGTRPCPEPVRSDSSAPSSSLPRIRLRRPRQAGGTTGMVMSGSSSSSGMSMSAMESGSMTSRRREVQCRQQRGTSRRSRRDQLAQHGNGNQIRDHHEHERCRRQRGGRSQHDQGRLVLHLGPPFHQPRPTSCWPTVPMDQTTSIWLHRGVRLKQLSLRRSTLSATSRPPARPFPNTRPRRMLSQQVTSWSPQPTIRSPTTSIHRSWMRIRRPHGL